MEQHPLVSAFDTNTS